jgi:hypothetical protein
MLVILLLLSLIGAALSLQSNTPAQVFLGDLKHPVASGEVWLVSHQWGHYPATLVASIRDGNFEPVADPSPIEHIEDSFDFRLLVNISERPRPMRNIRAADEAYAQDLHRDFDHHYLSAPMEKSGQGRNWATVLKAMGSTDGDALILTPPVLRTLQLLYPDGRPFAGADIPVILFGTAKNHCGYLVGPEMGTFHTNPQGQIALKAPPGSMGLRLSFYRESHDGPAGINYILQDGIVTGPEAAITLRNWWNLPERSYTLTLRTNEGKPLTGARLTGCLWNEVCGATCGPIPMSGDAADASGQMQFKNQDLRSMRTITVVNTNGAERPLSKSEMGELMTAGKLTLIWR